MPAPDFDRSQPDSLGDQSAVQCDACQSVLQGSGQRSPSFLLLDDLRMPLISCDDHLERFTSVCALTTDDTAELLDHRPAGGIRCPGCRHAPHRASQPMIPVQDGGIVVLACPEHHSELLTRFQTGLETQQQLTSGLETSTDPSL